MQPTAIENRGGEDEGPRDDNHNFTEREKEISAGTGGDGRRREGRRHRSESIANVTVLDICSRAAKLRVSRRQSTKQVVCYVNINV